ncbi:J domain-containing protein [Ramlibacter tataouinensis]|uniref:J domain-containing protein n=1 Tax=Ramlibacter tataouinensis TaxID=94132 RepID=UPI0022F3DE81|nr:J domain-containing protein [Ramlibacter tataouinensis]WBY02952.1 J domain-containing protein [Ramlibacter tataouinensis]
MSNAALQSLLMQPDAADPVLAMQQARFNALMRDVALWRAALAEWTERLARYQQAIEPVRRELHAAWRQWVFALDDASLQTGLTRAERAQLGELLRESIAALLAVEDDAEIAAVARRHEEGPSSVPSRQQAETDGAPSDDEPLEDLAPEWERQAAAAAAQRAERAATRRADTVSKRGRQAAQDASQSLRDVYRRLASALHPDRERDARQRERKTELMQEANRAYAEGNLPALLELRLQAEQVDAAHLAAADRRRVQHYVTVLQEQLVDLQSETRRLEAEFRAAAGLAPGSGLQPRKADRIISSEIQRLRGELLLLRRQTRVLRDVEALKRWLREQRKP